MHLLDTIVDDLKNFTFRKVLFDWHPEIDQSRPYSSEYRENWLENQARKKLRSKKESKSDNQQEKEGTTYLPEETQC